MKNSIFLKRLASLALGVFLGSAALFAQKTITVTGTVTDAQKEPIIGASVIQSGTTVGTATDIDGNFTLQVPEGVTLEISSIGFADGTFRLFCSSGEINRRLPLLV